MRHEGIAGIYRGYGATLASFAPFSGLYFLGYEAAKARAQRHLGLADADALPFGWQVATACAAGAAASLATNPLDMAKLRLQVQRAVAAVPPAGGGAAGAAPAASATPQYRNFVHGLRSIVAHEGWTALFRGAGARMAFHAPSTAITMTAFEQCKAAFARLLQPPGVA